MPETETDFNVAIFAEFNTRIRDIEEKVRLLKERVLLIGQNIIEIREAAEKEITELKLLTQELKIDVEKIKSAIIRIEEELDKKARKSELEILQKQAKIFQPLEFVRREELKELIKK